MRTWNGIFFAAVRRGDDPCHAIWRADQWREKRMTALRGALQDLTDAIERAYIADDNWERDQCEATGDEKESAHARVVICINKARQLLQGIKSP